jgi:flagellar basal-body rod protein FlgC
MDYRAAFQISAAGMTYEKTRLEVSAMNLANMHSAIAPGTQGYRPMRAVAQPFAVNFASLVDAQAGEGNVSAATISVLPMNTPARLVSDPGHPHADAQGFVRYPGVDHASEMIVAMTALRAYEANVAAVGFARAMANRALDIGGQR